MSNDSYTGPTINSVLESLHRFRVDEYLIRSQMKDRQHTTCGCLPILRKMHAQLAAMIAMGDEYCEALMEYTDHHKQKAQDGEDEDPMAAQLRKTGFTIIGRPGRA